MWAQPLPALWELPLTLMVVWESTRSMDKSVMLSLSLYCALYDKSNWGITFLRPDTPILHQIYENIHYTLVKIVDYEKYIQGGPKKNRISSQKPAWKAWCCESCLTSLPLPTGPYLTFLTLLGFTGPYWALLGLTGPYWALLGLTGPYWALLGLTGPYWALLSLTEPYWALLGLTRPY